MVVAAEAVEAAVDLPIMEVFQNLLLILIVRQKLLSLILLKAMKQEEFKFKSSVCLLRNLTDFVYLGILFE